MEPLRFGALGAARISDMALIQPSRITGDRLVAVAARDRSRAEDYARQHGFERVFDDYQSVIDDPEVDVVYNPLANGLHAPWNLRAVEAGKHVLSEKPYASNADEARRVRDAAAAAGVHVVEAFHYRYHPVQNRVLEVAASGEIGEIVYAEARMLMPPPPAGDLRWDFVVAGGGLMDVGCYAVHGLRDLAGLLGGEPSVVRARAGEIPAHPGIDAWLAADMAYPNGVPAHIETSMTHGILDFSFRVVGSKGEVFAPAFVLPHTDDRVMVTVGTEQRVEELGTRTSYTYMLEALRRLIRDGEPMTTDADDAVVTMQIIDDIYGAAGMPLRPVTTLD
ncbi:MAG: gfo/Idh/MocA family oxidoreductase [Actinomycetales bacterium]|nr:gfo/Idh/MocA family oxidoreductase [Actinomycetales bacterium]